jgi:hypothetical protein
LLSGRDPSSFHRQDQQILQLPTAAEPDQRQEKQKSISSSSNHVSPDHLLRRDRISSIGFIGQLEYLEAIKENKNTLNSSFMIDWFRDPRKKPTSVKLKESPRYREKSYSS